MTKDENRIEMREPRKVPGEVLDRTSYYMLLTRRCIYPKEVDQIILNQRNHGRTVKH